MTTLEAEALARGHYRRQQATVRAATAATAQQWQHLDPADVTSSWAADVGPRVLAAATAAQLQAAQASSEYVPAALAAQGGVPAAAGALVAEALAGVASDGRDLLSLLSLPVGLMKRLIGEGASPEDASGQALRNLLMLVGTQVADAGRVAAGVGIVADTSIAGHERVVTLPACGRCIILAGRLYTYSTGFQRHPRCDCQMIPVTDEQWRTERPGNTPEALFAQMSPEQQAKAFTTAGAKAIRDGADIGQVVNARRGMTTAGGRRFTTEGTTARGLAGRRLGDLAKQAGSKYRRSGIPRVMPEQLYADAERYGWSRNELLRQLERFGYITGRRDRAGGNATSGGRSGVLVSSQRSSQDSAPEPVAPVPSVEDVTPSVVPEAHGPAPAPKLPDVKGMSDDELEAALLAAIGDEFDEAAFEAISAEIDRREAEQRAVEERRAANRERARRRREREEEQRAERLRDLLDAGVDEEEAVAEAYGISIEDQRRERAIADLRDQGYTGDRFEDLARQSYKDYLYRQWLAAEETTRGVLLTREGENAGIDPRDLFHGPEARARKWASDELKAWWDANGRLTFAEWKAQLLDDSAEARRIRSGGGDFLT